MKSSILIIFFACALWGCENEFSPNRSSPSVPLVYAVFNEADSTHFIRISKSFQSNENVLTNGIASDSLIYTGISVRLERWFAGNFVQEVEFELTKNHIRVEGIFPESTIPLYELKRNPENELFFFPYPRGIFRLVIDIPDQPIVFSEFRMVRPMFLFIPKKDGKVYNMFDFKTRFTTHSNYVEFFVRVHYLNRYPDSVSSEITEWKEFHDHEMFDPEQGKEFVVPVEGYPLFERIGKLIPDDDQVSNRKFEYLEILYNCLGENIYQYNESLLTIPSDQAGRPYSNVVNGMGIVGSRYTTSRTVLFDYRSLSELCEGEYTKHLKFVKW